MKINLRLFGKKLAKRLSYKNYLPQIAIFLLIALLNITVGCSYYKVKTAKDLEKALSNQVTNPKKLIIVHQEGEAWQLMNVDLNEENKELSGVLVPLTGYLQHYKTTKPKKLNRYKPREGSPIYQVHIYTSGFSSSENQQVSIPYAAINKIDIYDEATAATIASYAFTTAGIVIGVEAILAIIVLLFKSSCPFVYTSNDSTYTFAGEMYGGAIYPSLERDDFMPLPQMVPSNGEYQLKITNELLEKQYTNLAELIVVQHPLKSSVLIDKQGKIQTITSPVSPSEAISNNHTDYLSTVTTKDSISYLFNEATPVNEAFSSLSLSFEKPAGIKTAKLVLNAKNSLWLDYMYGKFNELFGTYYNTFAAQQKKEPARKNLDWSLQQGIPLIVSVETTKGWEVVDHFNVVGPLASRDIVMPLDVSNIQGDKVKVKLECGFMFWELDYVAMDFSENITVDIKRLSATSAIDEKGKDVKQQIRANDDQYLVQPEVGNEVVVTYTAPKAAENSTQTAFLHSKGYYEYIRDYQNTPDFVTLFSFRKEGAFTKFSKQHYFDLVNDKVLFAKAINYNNGN